MLTKTTTFTLYYITRLYASPSYCIIKLTYEFSMYNFK